MIFIASDHRGFKLKNQLIEFLKLTGREISDLGPFEFDENDDYTDYAAAVAEKVTADPTGRGIVICGSGVGVAVAANKIRGARAGTIFSPEQAEQAVNDDNLNVLALSADFTPMAEAEKIVMAFLNAKFSDDERYRRRIQKIKDLENG
jgi:ribose 5-phosphate isomerase B